MSHTCNLCAGRIRVPFRLQQEIEGILDDAAIDIALNNSPQDLDDVLVWVNLRNFLGAPA